MEPSLMIAAASATFSQPQQPTYVQPLPPRMSEAEFGAAVVDLADRFAAPSGTTTRVTDADIKRQLGNVPPATATLMQLVLKDPAVLSAVRGAVPDDGRWRFNAYEVTSRDLAELKAEVQRNQGRALTELRAAVRVSP